MDSPISPEEDVSNLRTDREDKEGTSAPSFKNYLVLSQTIIPHYISMTATDALCRGLFPTVLEMVGLSLLFWGLYAPWDQVLYV
jgi:hypothetical protein